MSWPEVVKAVIHNPTPQLVGGVVVIALVAMPIGANLWMVHEFTLASRRIESSVLDLVHEVRLLTAFNGRSTH